MDSAESSSEGDPILLTIDGCVFDVTNYASNHPGEGYHDIYLEDYAGKDVSKEFAYYHSKKDKPTPQKIVERVKEKGKYKRIVLVSKDEEEDD